MAFDDMPELKEARASGQVYPRALDIRVPPTVMRVLHAHTDRLRGLVVGGGARDAVLGFEPKDIDIEIYGINYQDLVDILQAYGRVDLVGRQFGVIKFRDGSGVEMDISVPRRENKTGAGHRDFMASFDPDITPREAAARRDFTVNALAWDPITGELHDYFGGIDDLERGILRATSPAFAEDALRVLRGLQFGARFGLRLDGATADMCRSLAHEYRHLPEERISGEWMKLAEKGKRPGLAFSYLVETGWIDLYPHLARLVGVPQDEEWHPEGTVDVHTAHVMDAMAEIADREGITGDDRAVLIFAALTHDLAKSRVEDGGTTQLRYSGPGLRWTSHGHEQAGGPMARDFLNSIGIKKAIVDRVVPLVENHLQHVHLASKKQIRTRARIGASAIRQLASRLSPTTVRELALLVEADHSGRPPLPKRMPEEMAALVRIAEIEGLLDAPPRRLVEGRDAVPYFGGRTGPHIGRAVTATHAAYLNGEFDTVEEAHLWLRNYVRKEASLVRGDDVLAHVSPGPEVRAALEAAWAAQLAGEFADEEGGREWLERYFAAVPTGAPRGP